MGVAPRFGNASFADERALLESRGVRAPLLCHVSVNEIDDASAHLHSAAQLALKGCATRLNVPDESSAYDAENAPSPQASIVRGGPCLNIEGGHCHRVLEHKIRLRRWESAA